MLNPICITTFLLSVTVILVLATRYTYYNIASLSTSSRQQQFRTVENSQFIPSFEYVHLPDQPKTIYDVVILGCGPAGLSASLFASRMGLSVLTIGSPSSGSLSATGTLDNFPSYTYKGGQGWLDKTMAQAASFGTEFVEPTWFATALEREDQSGNSNDRYLHVTLRNDGNHDSTRHKLHTKTVIIATGSSPRKLELSHEAELWGHSLHNCALCDGDLYAPRSFTDDEKSVAVIGGGDAALEAVSLLARLGIKNIHWIHRRDEFRARQSAIDNLTRRLPNVKVWKPFVVTEWIVHETAGRKVLEGVRIVGSNVDGIADPEATSSLTIPCDGAFLMIGSEPNTKWLGRSGVSLDSVSGLIKVASSLNEADELTALSTATSVHGVFAAGEVVDDIYRQALTASSDGAKAAMDAERYIRDSSFGVVDVDVQNKIVPRELPHKILSDTSSQPYMNIDCDLTNMDCIKTLVSKHTVVVFSKPYCPYCRRALEAIRSVMKNKGESPFIVDLTEMGAVQETLGELTGRQTVPNIFVKGNNIGGGDETIALYKTGKLAQLING